MNEQQIRADERAKIIAKLRRNAKFASDRIHLYPSNAAAAAVLEAFAIGLEESSPKP